MTDRHKTDPKAVRMPDGLLAWYKQHATGTGQSVNRAIVAALEDYRRRHEGSGGKPPEAAKARQSPGAEDSVYDEPAPEKCGHPRVRVKGTCPDCFTYMGGKS